MLFRSAPNIFNPKFEIVSCFIEYAGNILMVHRCEKKSEGNKWGLPAGKINKGESLIKGIIREVNEETKISLGTDEIIYLGKHYIKYDDYDFVYHSFKTILKRWPEVIIPYSELKGFSWVSPYDAIKYDLVTDLKDCILQYYILNIRELLRTRLTESDNLKLIYAKTISTIKECRRYSNQVGYVSGIITSEGKNKVQNNLRILDYHTNSLKNSIKYPVFSAHDVFTDDIIRTLSNNGIKAIDYELFWDDVIASGLITDIFMTPRWQLSRGAKKEHKASVKQGIKIHLIENCIAGEKFLLHNHCSGINAFSNK